ncbi:uncharacterized protein LOC131659150, partial [Vicia villosa]|uniref:uncharacterized protein LOC131659150 n=1 Tax=Vicia villosa TaxID=3911 RepID=UPI00273C3684
MKHLSRNEVREFRDGFELEAVRNSLLEHGGSSRHGQRSGWMEDFGSWTEVLDLSNYSSLGSTLRDKRSKCLKFVNGLRPDIKKAIGYQQITRFAQLINKSPIYDEDSRESASHYKAMNDKKGQFRGKPYDNKKKAGFGGKPSGGGSSAPIKCFKCGVEGHRAVNCSKVEVTCFKCGKSGHKANECRGGSKVTCYNCGEQGHISTKCDKPKKEQAKGKVFALSGAEASTDDRLIQGTCFINGTPLIAIIDTGATHSFISLGCAKRLNLVLSDMHRSMVIDTPAMGSVSTSFVCLNCPLSIFGRDFGIDLVCLPLEQLDVILGMNWLEFNRVYINCFDKTIIFPEIGVKEDLFLSAKQVGESVQDGAELFMLLATLDVHERRTIDELPIVCDFAEVFPEDVSDLPPKREVEFSIDLVPGTSPVSMAPYRMSASELKELKSQLEDLLEKKFIRPSVSP